MADRKLVQAEKDHNKKAFEVYYALGPKRSQEAVAKKLGMSVSTIKNWSRSFNWRGRVAERDAEVAREIANKTITDEVSRRKRNLQIVNMSLVQLAKSIAAGKLRMTLSDLDRLIRLELLLTDQPDGRQEIIFGDLKNKSREELKEMLQAEMGKLKQLEDHDREIEKWEREGKLLASGEVDQKEVSENGH
jgi:transposase